MNKKIGVTVEGRTCLVTGATGGIGLAAANGPAAKGATVLVHGRDADKARMAAANVVAASRVQPRKSAGSCVCSTSVDALLGRWQLPRQDGQGRPRHTI